MDLILASRSPRRAELLRAAGYEFMVRAADIDETPREGEDPLTYVLRMAEEKARTVSAGPDETVLAADTTVVCASGEILGKPADDADASRMLRMLSGRRHEVITGICLRRGEQTLVDSALTAVWFSVMTEDEIASYVASGEPTDKAGAYAIQGRASKYVERIDGSYSNVVGLPVAKFYQAFRGMTRSCPTESGPAAT